MTFPGFPDAAPLDGFLGGLMIGLAAAIMLLGLGRIAGVSGLASRAMLIERGGAPWPVAILFVAGLVLGAILFGAAEPIEAVFPPHWGWLVAGGLFVGYGTRLGSGCTSGHGVCGMSRLSPRSLVATGVFMASGIATVALVHALCLVWCCCGRFWRSFPAAAPAADAGGPSRRGGQAAGRAGVAGWPGKRDRPD